MIDPLADVLAKTPAQLLSLGAGSAHADAGTVTYTIAIAPIKMVLRMVAAPWTLRRLGCRRPCRRECPQSAWPSSGICAEGVSAPQPQKDRPVGVRSLEAPVLVPFSRRSRRAGSAWRSPRALRPAANPRLGHVQRKRRRWVQRVLRGSHESSSSSHRTVHASPDSACNGVIAVAGYSEYRPEDQR